MENDVKNVKCKESNVLVGDYKEIKWLLASSIASQGITVSGDT